MLVGVDFFVGKTGFSLVNFQNLIKVEAQFGDIFYETQRHEIINVDLSCEESEKSINEPSRIES